MTKLMRPWCPVYSKAPTVCRATADKRGRILATVTPPNGVNRDPRARKQFQWRLQLPGAEKSGFVPTEVGARKAVDALLADLGWKEVTSW